MTNTKELIIKLKETRIQKGYSISDIENLLEKNGQHLSRSTISRFFSEGSEDVSFRYEETIKPIADVLLDTDNIEETDNMDVQAMKSLLKYKAMRIEELEKQVTRLEAALDKERIKGHEKFAKERELCNDRIEFLTSQIEIKDKRIDQLMEENRDNFKQLKELIDKFMHCPYRKD